MNAVLAGVDVGGTRIKIGLADDSGCLLSSRVLETHDCGDAEGFLSIVAEEIMKEANAANVVIRGVGVGCPGRIDFASGKVVWLKTKLEFLEGVPLSDNLRERLGCPVTCDNDVNAILAGEMKFGRGRGYQDVVALTIGTGIGGALVIGGKMVRGRNWATGHFGYLSLDPCGPRHVSGNTGIVEEHASQSGILRQLRVAIEAGEKSTLSELFQASEEPGLREVFIAAQQGDSLARRLADRMMSELGVLVSNLIYALDPELVLVGGGLISHRPEVLDAIRYEVRDRIAYLPANGTELEPMALGDVAGVLGGVALAIDTIGKRDEVCVTGV